jgi:hypothetical protein
LEGGGGVSQVTRDVTALTSPDVLVYLAGPYSGADRRMVEANIRRAVDRAVEVARLGAMPVCPHSNTGDPMFEAVQNYDFWIRGTMALMRCCHALLTVEGWELSSGARGEVKEMLALGKPVFHDVSELKDWLWRRKVDPRVA